MQSIAGSAFAGGTPLDGTIRGLSAEPSFSGGSIAWTLSGVDPDVTGHYQVLMIDGEASRIMPGATQNLIDADLVEDGIHRIDIQVVRPETDAFPAFISAPYGRRARISWTPSTDSDTVSYDVYQRASGDAEYAVAATVDTINVHPRLYIQPDTGTGSGRISIDGNYNGPDTNVLRTIAIGSGGTYTHNGGSSTAITQGPVALGDGIRVVFHDAPASYVDGDEYAYRIGPLTYWLSPELPQDTYEYQVRAIDAAGNESDANGFDAVAIIHLPDPVEDLEASWDGTDIQLDWTLPQATPSAILVYTNYNVTTGRLEDHVIETGPMATLSGTAENHSITSPASGEWQIHVRPRDADGRINDSVELATVDTSGPPTAVALANPEDLLLSLLPGGGLRVSWAYDWEQGGGLVNFRVYYAATEGGLASAIASGTPYATVPAGTSAGFVSYIYDEVSDLTENGTHAWVVVRAGAGSSETQNTDSQSIALDADSPGLPGTTDAATT